MPWLTPWSRVTCPYCFTSFHLGNATRTAWPAAPENTAPPPPAPGVPGVPGVPAPPAPPNGGRSWLGWTKNFYVPAPAQSERALCPNRSCGKHVPSMLASGEASSEVIAVVGAQNAGKSNFFGVLIRELTRRYKGEVGFDMVSEDTWGPGGPIPTDDLFGRRYGQYLFSTTNRRAVPKTVGGGGQLHAGDPRIPLIYLFRFPTPLFQRALRPWQTHKPIYFMVHDAAGEDMLKDDVLEEHYSFLQRATGIIFLLDPLDFPGIRSQLPGPIRDKLDPPMTAPSRIIDRVFKLFQKRSGLRGSGQIRVPVAFTLTKSDMFDHIDDLLYEGSAVVHQSSHRGGYDVDGCEELHREVAECIRRWGGTDLIKSVAEKFRDYRYFALSALGSLPNKDRQQALEQPIVARRVADPLLWLLWMRGYLKKRSTPLAHH